MIQKGGTERVMENQKSVMSLREDVLAAWRNSIWAFWTILQRCRHQPVGDHFTFRLCNFLLLM